MSDIPLTDLVYEEVSGNAETLIEWWKANDEALRDYAPTQPPASLQDDDLIEAWKSVAKTPEEKKQSVINENRYELAVKVLGKLNVLLCNKDDKFAHLEVSRTRNKINEQLNIIGTQAALDMFSLLSDTLDTGNARLIEEASKYETALQRANDNVVKISSEKLTPFLATFDRRALESVEKIIAVAQATRPSDSEKATPNAGPKSTL